MPWLEWMCLYGCKKGYISDKISYQMYSQVIYLKKKIKQLEKELNAKI